MTVAQGAQGQRQRRAHHSTCRANGAHEPALPHSVEAEQAVLGGLLIDLCMAASQRAAMPKTIHRHKYKVLLRLIRERRERAGMTQPQCSKALGRAQSFISDIERGVRRLDVVRLRDLCRILKTDLPTFA